MEVKQLWRTILHRMKSNKITFTACIFVTLFLWHVMTTGNPNIKNASEYTSEHIDDDQSNIRIEQLIDNNKHRDLKREEDVKIDIRGLNKKLDTITKINANPHVKSQIYSLTNIDPDVAKGETAQVLMGGAFHVLDNFIDTNASETYKGMKSMFSMWNPKTSKVIICYISP